MASLYQKQSATTNVERKKKPVNQYDKMTGGRYSKMSTASQAAYRQTKGAQMSPDERKTSQAITSAKTEAAKRMTPEEKIKYRFGTGATAMNAASDVVRTERANLERSGQMPTDSREQQYHDYVDQFSNKSSRGEDMRTQKSPYYQDQFTKERDKLAQEKFTGKKEQYTPEVQKAIDMHDARIARINEQYMKLNNKQRQSGRGRDLMEEMNDIRQRKEKFLRGRRTIDTEEYKKFKEGQSAKEAAIGEKEKEVARSQSERETPINGETPTGTTGQRGSRTTTGTSGTGMGDSSMNGMAGGVGMGQEMMGLDLPQFSQSNLAMATNVRNQDMMLIDEQRQIQDQSLARKARLALQGTDFNEKAISMGMDPNNMTVDQITDFASSQGIELSEDWINRIKAGGLAQMEQLDAGLNDQKAIYGMAQGQLERKFDRALDENEQHNIQADIQLRRMLAAYGGGEVETMAGNAAVLHQQQKNQQIKNDLLATYGDKKTTLAINMNGAIRENTYLKNEIQRNMTDAIEDEYSKVTTKLDELLDQEITNEQELRKAMIDTNKTFADRYIKITSEGAKMMDENNKWLADHALKVQSAQREDDKMWMDRTGFVIIDGDYAKDPLTGEKIPTFDNYKFEDQRDRDLSEQYGFIVENGDYKTDSQGRFIPTFSREKEIEDARRFGVTSDLAQDRYDLDVKRYEREGKTKKEAQDLARDTLIYNMKKDGYSKISTPKGFEGGMQSSTFNPEKSSYGGISYDDGSIRINIEEGKSNLPDKRWDGRKLNKNNYQCGEFVNDTFGSGVMGDTFTDKMKKVVTNQATAGSAFVQDIGKWGHTGIVESVQKGADGRPISMEIVDANRGKDGNIRRDTVEITYDERGNAIYTRDGVREDIKGFTEPMTGQPVMPIHTGDYSDVVSMGGEFYAKTGAPGVSEASKEATISRIKAGKTTGSEFAKLQKQAEDQGWLNEFTDAVVETTKEPPKVLQPATLTMLADAKFLPTILDGLEGTIESGEVTFDPVWGTLKSFNPYDVEQKTADAELRRVAQLVGRFMEDGVLRKEDEIKYRAMLPNSSDVKDVARNKLTGIRKMLRQKYAGYIDVYGEGGYDVEQFEKQLNELTGEEVFIQNNAVNSLINDPDI